MCVKPQRMSEQTHLPDEIDGLKIDINECNNTDLGAPYSAKMTLFLCITIVKVCLVLFGTFIHQVSQERINGDLSINKVGSTSANSECFCSNATIKHF